MDRTQEETRNPQTSSSCNTPGWISLHDLCVKILEMFIPIDNYLDSVLKEQHKFGDILIANVLSDSIVQFICDKRLEAAAFEIDIIHQLNYLERMDRRSERHTTVDDLPF